MPDTTTLLLFALAASVLIAIPGPNHLYIATRAITGGRRAGLASAAGVETGTLIHIAAAAAGLSAIIASSAVAFDLVRYLGAAYLVFLGIKTLRGGDFGDLEATGKVEPLRRVYVDGLLVNLLNPKVALFFLSFLPQFLDPSKGSVAVQIVILGLVLVMLGVTSNIAYALIAVALGVWLKRRPTFLPRQQLVAGGIYLSLGFLAALAGDRRH
jgi:threonine/homoserine/homoserine lactone efflux protein